MTSGPRVDIAVSDLEEAAPQLPKTLRALSDGNFSGGTRALNTKRHLWRGEEERMPSGLEVGKDCSDHLQLPDGLDPGEVRASLSEGARSCRNFPWREEPMAVENTNSELVSHVSTGRSERRSLTWIPETAEPITYHTRIALIGRGARSLAVRLCPSDAAEAGGNRGRSRRKKQLHGVDRAFSEEEEWQYSFFCRLEGGSMVSTSFELLEDFTDEIPDVLNEEQARDMGMVLLHVAGQSTVEQSERTCRNRFMEICHHMHCLPLVFLLIVGATSQDCARLNKFVRDKPLKSSSRQVEVLSYPDDTDMELHAAFANIVANVIANRARAGISFESSSSPSCCTVV